MPTPTSLARMKIDGIVYLIDPITCKAYTCDDAPTEVGHVTCVSTEPATLSLHIRPDISVVLQTKRDALECAPGMTHSHSHASLKSDAVSSSTHPSGSHPLATASLGAPTCAV